MDTITRLFHNTKYINIYIFIKIPSYMYNFCQYEVCVQQHVLCDIPIFQGPGCHYLSLSFILFNKLHTVFVFGEENIFRGWRIIPSKLKILHAVFNESSLKYNIYSFYLQSYIFKRRIVQYFWEEMLTVFNILHGFNLPSLF